jgi:glycerate kinase
MPVIVIAPDSYKGALSAQAVACAMEAGIRRVLPDAAIHRFPMADGGEGTVDAVLAARSGEVRHAEVADAAGRARLAGNRDVTIL